MIPALSKPKPYPPLNRAAGKLQGQPARLLVALDLHGAVRARCSRNSSPTTGRSWSYKGELCSRCFVDYPERSSAASRGHRLSRSGHPGRDRRQWLDDLAADPLFLRTVNNDCRPGADQADLAADDRKRSAAPRYAQGADDPNAGFGNWNWLGTDDQGATCWRA
jgi:hypothetical protein